MALKEPSVPYEDGHADDAQEGSWNESAGGGEGQQIAGTAEGASHRSSQQSVPDVVTKAQLHVRRDEGVCPGGRSWWWRRERRSRIG